jgi:NRPS condensation-like uncharacterized protein
LSHTVPLGAEVNVAALEQALNEIIRRHEALRTTFSLVDGQPVQVVAPSLIIELPLLDLSTLSKVEREAKVNHLTAESQRPFNLATGPLLRVSLVRLIEREHLLLLTMHHIISDGWSMSIFIRELTTLYKAYSAGHDSPLKELSVQYADFAQWQHNWLQGDVLEQQLAYWKQQLQGASILELPTDRPRPPVQSYGGAYQSFILPE